eukprot:Gb_31051 [translate_table: standard]
MRWERVKAKTKSGENLENIKSSGRKGGSLGPGKRWGHTCNAVKNGRSVYVFGGYGKDNCQTNDVHIFDSSKQTWIKPMLKGNPPTPRDSHSCTTVGTCLFVFGGTDGQNPLKDLHILDTEPTSADRQPNLCIGALQFKIKATNSWIEPEVHGEGPAAREGHSAALIGHRLFVFGGCGKTEDAEEIYYNDLYILDTTNLTWTRAVTSGRSPSPRDSHTCSSWNNKIVVVGGEDASDSYLSDVHVLDADTLAWEQLKTSGQILMPRAGHSTVSLGKHLFVFGGFTDDRNLFDDLHVLNIETGVWTKAVTNDLGPSARFSVAGDCLDYKRGILVFIGGCNENLEALDDLYYLNTEMIMENEQEEQKPEKFSLRRELKRKRQEHHVSLNNPEKERNMPKLDGDHISMLPQARPSHTPAGTDKFSLYDFKPVEEKIFEAKITDVFHYGYTIESNIEGKHLRGLLFSYKPGFAHAVHAYLTRKNLASEASTGKLKETQKPKLKVARATKQSIKRAEDGQPQAAVDAESTEQGLVTGSLASPSNQILAFSEQYQQHMQPAPLHSSTGQHDPKPDAGSGFAGVSHSRELDAPVPPPIEGGIYATENHPSPSNHDIVGNQSTQENISQAELEQQQTSIE